MKYGLGRIPSPPDARDFRLSRFLPISHRLWAYFYRKAMLWECDTVLNQKDTPHCVGFSLANYANCLPIDDEYTNDEGHKLYYEAKVFDGEPNEENGSTVRTGAKVLKNRGRIDGYAFVETMYQITTWLLTEGPVIVGTDWYKSMMEPDKNGYVRISGENIGGHAYCAIGFSPIDNVITFLNSWGSKWGQNGRFKAKVSEWERLFNDGGEALVAVELSKTQKE